MRTRPWLCDVTSPASSNAQVLQKRRQRHCERCREFGHDGWGRGQPFHDRPTGRVRESSQHGVELVAILRHVPKLVMKGGGLDNSFTWLAPRDRGQTKASGTVRHSRLLVPRVARRSVTGDPERQLSFEPTIAVRGGRVPDNPDAHSTASTMTTPAMTVSTHATRPLPQARSCHPDIAGSK